MVTKKKSTGRQEEKRGKVKVGKLKLNKETISDLTSADAKRVKGGNVAIAGLIGVVAGAVKAPPPPTPTSGPANCIESNDRPGCTLPPGR